MNSPSYLIDTDWVTDHLNGMAPVTQRLRELKDRGLTLSIISIAELWEGVFYSSDPARSRTELENFLAGMTILGLDEETCKRFGNLRGSLRQRGKVVADFDLLIAATALRRDLVLLTNNRRHFETIPGLQIETLTS